MIKMDIKTVYQAKCPYCGSIRYLHSNDREVYCYCDEGQNYTKDLTVNLNLQEQ